jgi:hypothetical protein
MDREPSQLKQEADDSVAEGKMVRRRDVAPVLASSNLRRRPPDAFLSLGQRHRLR